MANRKMRYVLSHTGKIHDRDCPHAVQIPDEAFDMCEDYPNGRYVCFVCYRKALVRRGLALDQTKYIDAAMQVFHEVGATNSDLNMLFLKYNAQIYHVEADSVYLKVNEDCWIVETACFYRTFTYKLRMIIIPPSPESLCKVRTIPGSSPYIEIFIFRFHGSAKFLQVTAS